MAFPQAHVDGEVWNGAAVTDLENRAYASILAHSGSGGVPGTYLVTDYGAVGDGVTDDTTHIQNAINAANSAGGGVVYCPPTNSGYRVATSLTLYSEVALQGAGPYASFLLFDDVATFGLVIDGTVTRTDNLTADFGPDSRVAQISGAALANYSIGDEVLFQDNLQSAATDPLSIAWWSRVQQNALPTAGQFMLEDQIPALLQTSQTARVSKLNAIRNVQVKDLGLVVTGTPGAALHRKCGIASHYSRDCNVDNVRFQNFCNDSGSSGNPLFTHYTRGWRIANIQFDRCVDVQSGGAVNSNTRCIDVYGATDTHITDVRACRVSGIMQVTQSSFVTVDGVYGLGDAAPRVQPPTISAALAAGGTLTVAQAYYYKVTAINTFGETTGSNEVTATPTSGNQTINLSWTVAGSNAWENAEGYRIYRGTAAGAENLFIGTATAAATGFTDNGIAGSAGTVPTISTTGAPGDGWGNRGIKFYSGVWYSNIINCIMHDFGFTGIRLHDSSYCHVTNCKLYGIRDNGLYESTSDGTTAAYSQHNIIADNICYNIYGGAGSGGGFGILAGGRYTKITGNQINNCHAASQTCFLFGTSQHFVNNTIRNPSATANAINVKSGGSKAFIAFNDTYGCTANSLDTSGSAGGNTVINNTFDKPVTLHAGDNTGAPFTGYYDAMVSFGAVGDGSTDDTTAIQSAINAANASGGGIVLLGPNTFRIATGFILRANVELRGAGMGATTLLFDDVASVGIQTPTVTASATTVLTANLNEFDTTAALTSATGFAAGNTIFFSTSTSTEGQWFTRATSVVSTTLTMQEMCPVSMPTSHSVQAQVVAMLRNMAIRDLTVKCAGTANRTQPMFAQYAEDMLVERVEFNTSGGTGVAISHGRNCTIRDCVLDSCATVGVNLVGVTNAVIEGNLVRKCTNGLALNACPQSTMANNIVQGDTAASGSGLFAISSSNYSSIAGNTVSNFNSAKNGITVTDSWALAITGNSIFNVGTGIELSASLAGRIHHITITGNSIRKTAAPGIETTPFAAGDSTYIIINDNTISSPATYCVNLTSSFNRIVGNIFTNYVTAGVRIPATGNPAGNVIANNTYDNAGVGTTTSIASTGLNTVLDPYFSDNSASAYIANGTSVRNPPKVFALTDGATVNVAADKGTNFTLSAGGSRTIAAPTQPAFGMIATFDILNNTGGAITTTWNAAFKLAGAWTDPATTKRRTLTVYYDGTNWVELCRAAADI